MECFNVMMSMSSQGDFGGHDIGDEWISLAMEKIVKQIAKAIIVTIGMFINN